MTLAGLDMPMGPECGCDAMDATPGLLTIDQAMQIISCNTGMIAETEKVALARAGGRVLAQDVTAAAPSPPFDNSAMDGFALNLADLAGDGPWILPVSACQAAGASGVTRLPRGTAVQIFTGAALPAGADAVIMQEKVEQTGSRIVLRARPTTGENIRRAGEDLRPGDTVVEAGRRLGARDIAAIAAAGRGAVRVTRRIRVALLATGDEVRRPGDDLGAAQIWDVNTPMLSAAFQVAGVDLITVRHGGDTRAGLRAALQSLSAEADLIVTTGGISLGAADHVKPALRDAGGDILFSSVAIKPGKPVSAGRIGGSVWLGLPGNPVSAFVTWVVFGQRILECLSGQRNTTLRRSVVLTGSDLRHRPGRCELRLASLAGSDGQGRQIVTFPDRTHSARVAHLQGYDGLALIPADTDLIPKGGMIEYLPFPPI